MGFESITSFWKDYLFTGGRDKRQREQRGFQKTKRGSPPVSPDSQEASKEVTQQEEIPPRFPWGRRSKSTEWVFKGRKVMSLA